MEEQTNFQVSASANEEIFEIVITGEVTKDTIDQLHTEVLKLLKGKNIKAILVDVRAVKAHNDAFAAAYFRARSLPPDINRLPSAVVDLNADEAYKSFYETTATNVGQSMRWFTDIEAARTWLKSRL